MYDAYISYVNDENDRKFVNFILKPHLENKYGYKLLLNHTDILPGAGQNRHTGNLIWKYYVTLATHM